MIVNKEQDNLVIDNKTIAIRDIAMISFKVDIYSDYYIEIDINDQGAKLYASGMNPQEAKYYLQKLASRLCRNGVNSFHQMGNRLINLGNVKSISYSKNKKRGRNYTIDIEFTNRSLSLVTNKTIAERAIAAFNSTFNQYVESVAL